MDWLAQEDLLEEMTFEQRPPMSEGLSLTGRYLKEEHSRLRKQQVEKPLDRPGWLCAHSVWGSLHALAPRFSPVHCLWLTVCFAVSPGIF